VTPAEPTEARSLLSFSHAPYTATSDRVARSVALLGRRGYALPPDRLGALCLGGAVGEEDVRWAVAAGAELAIVHDLVVERHRIPKAGEIRARSLGHGTCADEYVRMTQRFVRALIAFAPFIRGVAIAGSLASGGFRDSDDVDLNLVVDDGHKHLAYVAVNVLGLLHALAHRSKPVDELTLRPIAPRLMTANLILERSQFLPLARQDEGMAFELMVSEPVYGLDVFREIIDANPRLLDHFPQLLQKAAPYLIEPAPRARLPRWLYPAGLDGAARAVGRAAWRYMQWTRRGRPDALARVEFVRETIRPYTLFDDLTARGEAQAAGGG
jgi:hypothetical protein